MLCLTIKNDHCIRIGDQQIRISISPFEKDAAEVWIWPPEPGEGSCNSPSAEYNALTVDE